MAIHTQPYEEKQVHTERGVVDGLFKHRVFLVGKKVGVPPETTNV